MQHLTQEDYKNLLILVKNSSIQGNAAVMVANLITKLESLGVHDLTSKEVSAKTE